MKIKDMALIGMGIGVAWAYDKYGVPMVKKASKAINAKIDEMMNQMM